MSALKEEPVFDPSMGVYRLTADWHAVEQPGILVVEAVAAVLNRDVLDLQPLQDVVDLESIDTLLHAGEKSPLSMEFEYEETLVEITRAGQLLIDVL
jgi:hypothetical protein